MPSMKNERLRWTNEECLLSTKIDAASMTTVAALKRVNTTMMDTVPPDTGEVRLECFSIFQISSLE